MFRTISGKFYALAAVLILVFGIGYAQLALFLRQQSMNAIRGQEAVLVEREIHSLMNLFYEIRVKDRAVFSQDVPEADREFGALLEKMRMRLRDLNFQAFAGEIKMDVGRIGELLTLYEEVFNRMMQLKTEQRLNRTIIGSTYQSLVSTILGSNQPDLLKPFFILTHFQTGYLESRRESEYQALKGVTESLEGKLVRAQVMDNRMRDYLRAYKDLVDKDFLLEREIRTTNDRFSEISADLAVLFSQVSASAEMLLRREFQKAGEDRKRVGSHSLIFTALIILTLLLILILMARKIVRPMRAMAGVIKDVKSGKARARFKEGTDRKDEVTHLGMALNEMLDTIDEDNHRLMAYQKELVNKAMEAGRAQLSAMVLHNIGNAITPVKVYTEGMKGEKLGEIAGYLERCYAEIRDQGPDIGSYVRDNPRGGEVFSYMGRLIEYLREHAKEKAGMGDRIERAVSYISDILTLQQSYAAKEQDSKEQTDLNGLIEHAIQMQASALEKREIKVERDLQRDLPRILIDKSRLMQAFVNFIKNGYEAIDDLPDGAGDKVIGVRSYARDGQVCVEIRDSGTGLEPEEIEGIFEFGRSLKGSSGVGLYYCKAFVEANSGELRISSSGRGKGATVSVVLPSMQNDHKEETGDRE